MARNDWQLSLCLGGKGKYSKGFAKSMKVFGFFFSKLIQKWRLDAQYTKCHDNIPMKIQATPVLCRKETAPVFSLETRSFHSASDWFKAVKQRERAVPCRRFS